LAVILFLVGYILVQRVSSQREPEQQEQLDTSFKKTEGDISLKVTKDSTNPEKLLISVSKKHTTLVTDYELPAQQFDLGWLDVDDARIFPNGDKGYRIILFSTESESDHDFAHNYIWLLTLNGKMSFDKMIDVSNLHKIPEDESLLFGNRVIRLPSFGETSYEEIAIPVEIQLGSQPIIKSMLNQHSLELLKQVYEKSIQNRMDKLSKSKDTVLLEKYKNASLEFDEAISGRDITVW
jgi:hypothetical protein